jgi:hypothetical protein
MSNAFHLPLIVHTPLDAGEHQLSDGTGRKLVEIFETEYHARVRAVGGQNQSRETSAREYPEKEYDGSGDGKRESEPVVDPSPPGPTLLHRTHDLGKQASRRIHLLRSSMQGMQLHERRPEETAILAALQVHGERRETPFVERPVELSGNLSSNVTAFHHRLLLSYHTNARITEILQENPRKTHVIHNSFSHQSIRY